MRKKLNIQRDLKSRQNIEAPPRKHTESRQEKAPEPTPVATVKIDEQTKIEDKEPTDTPRTTGENGGKKKGGRETTGNL